MKSRLALVAALALVSCGPATDRTEMKLDTGAKIAFTHPASWNATVKGPSLGPTLELGPGKLDFKVLITAIPRKNGRFGTQAELEEGVREKGRALLSTSLQTDLLLLPVAGPEAKGFLYHLTDKKTEAGPGDYRELHQGALVIGPYLLSATILTHTTDLDTVDEAMKVLASATYYEPN